jgi:hypothetical protein
MTQDFKKEPPTQSQFIFSSLVIRLIIFSVLVFLVVDIEKYRKRRVLSLSSEEKPQERISREQFFSSRKHLPVVTSHTKENSLLHPLMSLQIKDYAAGLNVRRPFPHESLQSFVKIILTRKRY